MHWILQENLFNEVGFEKAIEVLERFSIPHSIHKVVPFVGELLPDIDPVGNVICMGSYSMRHIAKKKGWFPGVFDLEPVNFNVQIERYGKHNMLNGDSIVCRFKDAVIDSCQAFMRPIEDSKVFAGKVFTNQELREWQHSIVKMGDDYGSSMNGDTLVQVCSIKEIYAEYRFWIVDNKIITQSLYKRGDKVIYSDVVDDRVIQYVQGIIHDTSTYSTWRPHDAYVIDVCETPNGMKIVELGTINSCGFYAANMTDLILSLNDAFSKRKEFTDYEK